MAFPLYLFLMRRLAAAVAVDPERRQSLVRRWLTYLTLVVGAAIILGDVIALLARLLAGDPTAGFFLKVAAILLITGPIFGYYLWDMRQAEEEVSESFTRAAPVLRGLVIGAVVVVIATLGYSIYLVGTPGQQRDVRLDDRRIDDLRNISHNIDTYLEINEELPGDLQDLKGPRFYVDSVEDPGDGSALRVPGEERHGLRTVRRLFHRQRRAATGEPRLFRYGMGPRCGQDLLLVDGPG